MLFPRNHKQVFRGIVHVVTVDMMNLFFCSQNLASIELNNLTVQHFS